MYSMEHTCMTRLFLKREGLFGLIKLVFIEMSASNQENEQSCICVRGIDLSLDQLILFYGLMLELFRHFGIKDTNIFDGYPRDV